MPRHVGAVVPGHDRRDTSRPLDMSTPLPSLFAACAVAALTLGAGCAPVQQEKTMAEYRQNPSPTQLHRVDVDIDNAPGEFGWIRGFMQFDVTNRECLPPPRENAGGYSSPIPTRSIPFELRRQPDGGYTGTVFTDGMVDEDYHGHGVCHWRLVNVQVQLKATGAPEETLFMADLYGDELESALDSTRSKTLHYWQERFPRVVDFAEFPDSGDLALADVPADRHGEFFKVTLTVMGGTR
ncbi:MAG: hypothetical protein A2579_07120 [Lysobacterales bacterium RIFOXYD1_FULL_69_11]|nr:MAG: hypothetical protein A2190_07225 [Xanthomonadales bacterium RIFOXYA1_FULL_69_10]OHE86186.1 MAG: hypothetical protein A2579_07120 [Xanthomonadales bacterium RIFOXYD1_FULL_69_11]